jgi:hypothetical protein
MNCPPMSRADRRLKNLWQEDASLKKILVAIAGSQNVDCCNLTLLPSRVSAGSVFKGEIA